MEKKKKIHNSSTKSKLKIIMKLKPGLPGPKKLKRPNLALSRFKKGQILKNEKRPNFLQKIC